ncbi:hypothetical protein CV102_16080 [Natronococcus pandeyae]|uniref:Uncharacterized protein n=1 Tax=Natronococcus pandeyae TaxID=2055836 RepID=A0A8J8TPJ4_9EURY|nr:hypothetical protein CV102_16080 [Natronococcus pandeyae]
MFTDRSRRADRSLRYTEDGEAGHEMLEPVRVRGVIRTVAILPVRGSPSNHSFDRRNPVDNPGLETRVNEYGFPRRESVTLVGFLESGRRW